MVGASLLFAVMGVCVKLASAQYGSGEIVMYRSLVGFALMAATLRLRGISPRSPVPGLHLGRSLTGVAALCLWFHAIAGLPLATAMTLNYMSSVWIALFLLGGSVLLPARGARPDLRLVAAVGAGFAGVAMVLRPTLEQQQLWHGLIGLGSGVLAAMAYLQVTALGRAGEPGERVVFWFSGTGIVAGAGLALLGGGLSGHTAPGVVLLLAIGTLATVAQWMMTKAYGSGATLGIASLQYLGIAFSFVLGLVVFDDRLTLLAAAGIVVIVGAGVAATRLTPRHAPSPRATNPLTDT